MSSHAFSTQAVPPAVVRGTNIREYHEPKSPAHRCFSQVVPQESKLTPQAAILKQHPPEDHKYIEESLQWFEGVVLGLNLCPFAGKPYESHQVQMEVINGSSQVDILARVLGECMVRQAKPGTSLMICPDLFPTNFFAFLEIYNMLSEGVLVDQDLTQDIQVAPFHPLFEFEGSGPDSVDNYTNRSPYPMFHVLREEEVSQAVGWLDGDASKVWKRNVSVLEALSDQLEPAQLDQLLRGESMGSDVDDTVKAILRESS